MEAQENICQSCVGACCRAGIIISIDSEEAAWMQAGGTEMQAVLEASPNRDWAKLGRKVVPNDDEQRQALIYSNRLEKGQGFYRLVSDCGNLVLRDGWYQCEAHEDPDRPDICNTFQQASDQCLTIRKNAGVETPVEISTRFGN